MTMEQLRYFITVAQLENISRASEVLLVNQPALSKNIIKLEAELGTPLFTRNGKKLSLNAQGERFMVCASIVLRELEMAQTDLQRMVIGSTGHIRIGAAGCNDKILACAAEFRTRCPECEFEFDFSVEELDLPDINDYDVLIYPEGSKYEKFSGYALGSENYYLAVANSHPLSEFSAVSVKQLAGLDYVFVRKGRFFTDFPHRVCTALNIPFQSVCYTDTRQSQMQIVASGMACALIPDGVIGCFANPNIKLIPLVSPRFIRNMKICFKRDKHLSPLAGEFKALAMERLELSADKENMHGQGKSL